MAYGFDAAAVHADITIRNGGAVSRRLDFRVVLNVDIEFRGYRAAGIFAGGIGALGFDIAVVFKSNGRAVEQFEPVDGICCGFGARRLEAVKLCVIRKGKGMSVIPVLYADLKHGVCAAADIGHLCVAVKQADTVELAGTVLFHIHGDFGIRNMKPAGHVGCFLLNAEGRRIQLARTGNGYIVRDDGSDVVDGSFRNVDNKLHGAVLNYDTAAYGDVVQGDIERLVYILGIVAAPDLYGFIGSAGKLVLLILEAKDDTGVVDLILFVFNVFSADIDGDDAAVLAGNGGGPYEADKHTNQYKNAQNAFLHGNTS